MPLNLRACKLICTDIDGTLLNAQRDIEAITAEAIHQLKQPVILASSRMPSAMRYLQEKIGQSNQALIAYNGALILDQKQQVIESLQINISLAQKIALSPASARLNMSIYSNDLWLAPAHDYWTKREENNTRVRAKIQDLKQNIAEIESHNHPIHKIMLMGEAADIDSILAEFGNNSEVHWYRSKPSYLEITPKGTNKSTALEKLLKHSYQEISLASVLAFGDNVNDLELIKNCGLGVAVGNATEELKSIADHVTLGNKEHGVARFILDNLGAG
jgi:Cof subfamily protein (haloacid dehalogenase superfamily)